MFNQPISKATTLTLSLVLPLLVVGLLLLGLPALTEAREAAPPPPECQPAPEVRWPARAPVSC